MAFYLVKTRLKQEKGDELKNKLKQRAFINLKPFGRALSYGLENARIDRDGKAVWEEEDYCSPPLAQERAAVVDTYFSGIRVSLVEEGQGWKQINHLPRLFSEYV